MSMSGSPSHKTSHPPHKEIVYTSSKLSVKQSEYSPPVHKALVDEPGEFALGHHSVLQVQATVLPDVRLPQSCKTCTNDL